MMLGKIIVTINKIKIKIAIIMPITKCILIVHEEKEQRKRRKFLLPFIVVAIDVTVERLALSCSAVIFVQFQCFTIFRCTNSK